MLYSRIEISPSDWLDWRNNSTTRLVMAALQVERDEWATKLIEGHTLVPGSEGAETGKVVGIIYGLDCALIGVGETLKVQWEEREEMEKGEETDDV